MPPFLQTGFFHMAVIAISLLQARIFHLGVAFCCYVAMEAACRISQLLEEVEWIIYLCLELVIRFLFTTWIVPATFRYYSCFVTLC